MKRAVEETLEAASWMERVKWRVLESDTTEV
jgi:hypothetical protein